MDPSASANEIMNAPNSTSQENKYATIHPHLVLGIKCVLGSLLFGVIVSGLVFLGVALRNAYCDQFDYINILFLAASVAGFFCLIAVVGKYIVASIPISDQPRVAAYGGVPSGRSFSGDIPSEEPEPECVPVPVRPPAREPPDCTQPQRSSRRSPADVLSDLAHNCPCCPARSQQCVGDNPDLRNCPGYLREIDPEGLTGRPYSLEYYSGRDDEDWFTRQTRPVPLASLPATYRRPMTPAGNNYGQNIPEQPRQCSRTTTAPRCPSQSNQFDNNQQTCTQNRAQGTPSKRKCCQSRCVPASRFIRTDYDY